MVKLDPHTHSIASPDGSLTEADYRRMLKSGGLDYIAITDHDTTAFARHLHQLLGDCIIIGQEITTIEGEIIGLYLSEDIPAGLSAKKAVAAIRKQHGLVYIPHPFETVRKGLLPGALEGVASYVDIVEAHNGRAMFQNKSAAAKEWATQHHLPMAAGSDAHGWHGWGKTYTTVTARPTRDTLVRLLAKAQYEVGSMGLRGVLYPKLNRLRKKV